MKFYNPTLPSASPQNRTCADWPPMVTVGAQAHCLHLPQPTRLLSNDRYFTLSILRFDLEDVGTRCNAQSDRSSQYSGQLWIVRFQIAYAAMSCGDRISNSSGTGYLGKRGGLTPPIAAFVSMLDAGESSSLKHLESQMFWLLPTHPFTSAPRSGLFCCN